ncbi:MAG TPA: hypothetical protein VE591_14335 [Candidatus Acidoferrum sp.]|nr:hypothetical protein [Candidatus Acidoferrum sp.]
MTQPQPVESIFSRAWMLLNRNWIIIVPGLLIGLVVGIVHGLLTPVFSSDQYGASVVLVSASSAILRAAISLIGYIATLAYTTGMAGAAWERGFATFADGAMSFREDAGRIVITSIGLVILGAIAAILALPTFFLSLLAFYLFTLYAMPAAIVGNRPGFSSIAESFRIAGHRFTSTLVVAILLAVIYVIAWIIAGFFSFAPFLGPIVAACIIEAVVAYATLVVVGEYLNLRAAGRIPPASPAAAPPV